MSRRRTRTDRHSGSDIRKLKGRIHQEIEDVLYEEPSLLPVGISNSNCLFKAREFVLYPVDRNRSPSADLVYVYYLPIPDQRNGRYHILALEAKASIIGGSYTHSADQEQWYAGYFRRLWPTFLDCRVTSQKLSQGTPYVNGDVFLSVGTVTREFSSVGFQYPVIWNTQNERLGRALGTSQGLFFTE